MLSPRADASVSSATDEVASDERADSVDGHFVVFVPGQTADPSELDRWRHNNIAGLSRPKPHEFLEVLPKSSSDKVLKVEPRAWLEAR